MFRCLLLLSLVSAAYAASLPCEPVDFNHGSIVCVCNSTYCDTLEPVSDIPQGQFYHLASSKAGARFAESFGTIGDELGEADVVVTLNRSLTYQKITGFGGAFTDAATINMAQLSEGLQKNILESYYGKDGLEYNIGRVNMGGCDFSTRLYTYDDVENDTELVHFALAEEDTDYKIPFILKALTLNPNMKLFASPWTAPKWMKTNNEYFGYGFLIEDYYQLWADYFVRFLEEYQKRNVTFWAVTAQNEPVDGTLIGFPFNCMGWTPEQQRDWIKNNLGPTLEASPFNATKIIMFDDQRPFIVIWTRTVLGDPEANKYISGVGIHWYWDEFPPGYLDTAHNEFPDKFMFGTEACNGATPGDDPVVLGSWLRGQLYFKDIVEDLNHWVTGWTDWNLVLDMEGGPNWEGNTVDAPIIADNVTDRAYKNPMFYALGHISKFLPENSVRIHHTASAGALRFHFVAVERPDGTTALVFDNTSDNNQTVSITDPDIGTITVVSEAHSWNTIVF